LVSIPQLYSKLVSLLDKHYKIFQSVT
jgi:hypothetical protein